MLIHLGMVECLVPFTGHCDLVFRKNGVWSIFLILLMVAGRNPKFGVWMHLGMAECHIPFLGCFDLDL